MSNENNTGNTATVAASGASSQPQTGVDVVNINTNEANVGTNSQSVANTDSGTVKSTQATSQERTFTQSEMDAIIKDRLDRANNSFLKHYGVKSHEELESKVNGAESIRQENVLIKNNIASERYDDVITHFKGKGIALDNDNLAKALSTHPEWVSGNSQVPPQRTTTKIGAEQSANTEDDELNFINKYFGVRPKKR